MTEEGVIYPTKGKPPGWVGRKEEETGWMGSRRVSWSPSWFGDQSGRPDFLKIRR